MKVTVTCRCNRCQSLIHGRVNRNDTIGFHVVNRGGAWSRLAKVGETIVCVKCLRAQMQLKKAE